MKGTNTFKFNDATMCAIVEHWIKSKMLQPTMSDVYVNSVNWDEANMEFVVEVVTQVTPSKK